MKSAWNKTMQWLTRGQRVVWFQYAALAIVILLPVLLPGYVFTLDMVFTPHIAWPSEVTNTYPLDVLLWLLNQLLPGDVVQKAVLLAILICSGVGMHLLIMTLAQTKSSVREYYWLVAAYFAGLFYVINPFIYARLMAGQWLVLLGYALLPFLIRALFQLLAQPTWRQTLVVGLWACAIIAVSIHFIGIVLILGVLFLAAAITKHWSQRTKLAQFTVRIVVAGFLALVLSGYWLIPALLGQNVVSEIALKASDTEFSAFATHSGSLGAVGEVLRLQGFWAEARQLFVLPQASMPLWGIIVLALWFLVGIGAVRAWKTHRSVAIVMIGSIIAGVILAASPLIQSLSHIFPLLGGYREPHKFTVLVAAGYAVLGAFGAMWLVEKRRHAKVWAACCLALPLLIAPTMLWAGGGQLQPRDYPPQWYSLNTQLKNLVGHNDKVLFLPWHMYASYSFSNGRIIANPADKFFEVPMIISADPEFAGIAPNRTDAVKQKVGELIDNPRTVARTLNQLGVRYVVLAKEQQWQDYNFLEELPRIYEDEKIILYEVRQ